MARPDTVIDAWFIPDTPSPRSSTMAQSCCPLAMVVSPWACSLAKGFVPSAGLHGILSVRDHGGSQTDVVLTAPQGPTPTPPVPLAQALLFAFLGGLIPESDALCVFRSWQ